jgi:hypothetical protein
VARSLASIGEPGPAIPWIIGTDGEPRRTLAQTSGSNDVRPRSKIGNMLCMMLRRPLVALASSFLVGLVASGCGGGAPMHSVREVQATFADHGLRLSVTERNRVTTSLLPTRYVRALRRTPALGTPPPSPGYEVVVFTNRPWLRDLPRHELEAQRALGGNRILRLSNVSTRHDNVFIVYPAGTPKSLTRLLRILQDI